MKRRVGAVVVALVVVAMVVWLIHGRARSSASATAQHTAERTSGAAIAGRRGAIDPRSLTRGSISGSVRDGAGALIANASVCAEVRSRVLPSTLTREPVCARTDAQGHYQIGNLVAAEYVAHAAAKPYRFETYHPTGTEGGRANDAFPLAAGEARTGVDFVLAHPGVEVTGVVLDVTGGPIAHAQVRGSARAQMYYGPVVDTDEQGRFSLWLDRGPMSVQASADGYAANAVWSRAPGTVEILLTPESSLAGSVVDAATGQPVEGARVTVDAEQSFGSGTTDLSDAQGKFRVDRLTPGRFTSVAVTDQGYGKSEGSTLVGLGQHVDGVVIKLFPAHRITGKILIGDTEEACPEGHVALQDPSRGTPLYTHRDHGEDIADGVLPGTYHVNVSCRGYLARDAYDPIKVADADVTGQRWRVDPGARIRGKVITKSGEPIEGAEVLAESIGGSPRAKQGWTYEISKSDGTFELAGLRAGSHRVNVTTDRAVAPHEGFTLSVTAGATVERDFVLDDGGKLTGSVVDDTGAPVAGVQIQAIATERSWSFGPNENVTSAADGTFEIDAMRAGDYRVTAQRTWRDTLHKPGTTDDAKQGERVVVRAGQTATVRLVVEGQHGTITGTVTDADGKPVADAFVSSAHESNAAGAAASSVSGTRSWWDDKPVVTSTAGAFTLTDLAPGAYTLRAYRKGGGEAVAEHVAVGSTATLQIKPTGSLEGTARRDGGPPQQLRIALHDLKTGFQRSESFYMTAGHFVINDLPAGHFDIDVDGDDSHKTTATDLAEGEAKSGFDVTLDALVSVTGRIVDHASQQPVPDIQVFAGSAHIGEYMFNVGDDTSNVSDEAGRFTLSRVSPGEVGLRGFPRDGQGSPYGFFNVVRSVAGSGAVDVGDIPLIKKRIKPGDKVGELGLHFAAQANDVPPAQREYKISWIDPTGPAARTELQIGDVITSVDGVDVTGANFSQWWTMSSAPPGTTLSLATRRGVTAAIVLAAP